MEYEKVIGLEVHCELQTHSKMFSCAPVTFKEEPNTKVNEFDLSLPGTMPVLNKRAVEFAIKVCHALHMDIDECLCFDRKNYYYSDLPKGFQITQEKRPLGKDGYLDIYVDGQPMRISIVRLHMEEDTAKQLHFDNYTLIDYNRAGIPLIEIVTKPCIHNGKQAAAYLEQLRQVFLYTGVSDAKMEEGSMRCDVNISLRQKNTNQLGTRTEIKNVNSISYVQKAIEYETLRQEEILSHGGTITQETRRYDEFAQKTVVMRTKGDHVDYKYYTEPNILPIRLDPEWIFSLKRELPMMPYEREKLYMNHYHLSFNDAHQLVFHKELSDFFEKTIETCQEYQLVCHWILGDVLAYLNKNNLRLEETKLKPEHLGEIINFINRGIISSKQAKQVFDIVIKDGKNPKHIIEEKNLKQISDPCLLTTIINDILDENSQSVQDYAAGKSRAKSFLVGQIMKKTKGQANPQITNDILEKLLKERIS